MAIKNSESELTKGDLDFIVSAWSHLASDSVKKIISRRINASVELCDRVYSSHLDAVSRKSEEETTNVDGPPTPVESRLLQVSKDYNNLGNSFRQFVETVIDSDAAKGKKEILLLLVKESTERQTIKNRFCHKFLHKIGFWFVVKLGLVTNPEELAQRLTDKFILIKKRD